ncbi:MAG: NlpC/P60 family protein [Desulfobacterales bacterium]
MTAKVRTPWLRLAALAAGLAAMAAGCAPPDSPSRTAPPASRPRPALPALRFTIQVGAFLKIDNAVRLTERLLAERLSAYHFIDESGFYKVRIGNFPSREAAVSEAGRLQRRRLIEEYFIIAPEDFPLAREGGATEEQFRAELVRTARRFIGVPYRWGGDSTVTGFDCSGLTRVVYGLNGLELPRTSGEQWRAGRPRERRALERGDLVFFATKGGSRVSHVGIYLGGEDFLHAPRPGSHIRVDSLRDDFYRRSFLGGRTYL